VAKYVGVYPRKVRAYANYDATTCICPVGTEYVSLQGAHGIFENFTYDGACYNCEDGYVNGVGAYSSVCSVCDATSQTTSSDRSRCLCNKEFYHVKSKSTGPEYLNPCIKCPVGAICDGSDALPRTAPGYFSSPDAEFSYLACVPAEACSGEDECADGYTGNADAI